MPISEETRWCAVPARPWPVRRFSSPEPPAASGRSSPVRRPPAVRGSHERVLRGQGGLERFGDALRLEVAHRGVTVASAHPTWIDTDLVRDTEAALPTFAATRKQLPGPLGAYTSVEECAQALVENLETRGRRVFVPRSVGVVSALRQLATGALAEKVMLRTAALRVPQLERDIAALDGQEFGRNSVGDRGRAG